MTLAIVGLIAGFFLLIKAAGYLVEGASSIAARFGISTLVIGLTVVALGTSAPELVVNILSAVKGTPALAVGNIMGSNLANILLILGIVALIKPIRVQLTTVSREIPFMLLAALMVLTMAADMFFDGAVENLLTRTNGISLLGFFVIFIYYTYVASRRTNPAGEKEKTKKIKQWKEWLFILGGLAGLVVGGNLIVDGAVTIAQVLGLSDGIIGLTIVALGTSLPELATSVVAVRRGAMDMAIGGIIGSNIFNIFFVLGTTAVIAPLPFSAAALTDAGFFAIVSVILVVSLFLGTRHTLTRYEAVFFLALYFGYMGYSVFAYL